MPESHPKSPQSAHPAAREAPRRRRHARALTLASGGTLVAALVFLVSGILSLHVSGPIGGALIAYAVLVALVGWNGWKGRPWAFGVMVFLALLHLLTGFSMVSGDRNFWVLIIVSLVTLGAAGKMHLDDLRRNRPED